MKIICLDYDGSYTDFPTLFDVIIDTATKQGHKVILATMRYEEEKDGVLKKLEKKLDKIYFTGRKAKQPYLASLGVYPDLWLDDNPRWILNDA